MVAAQQGTPNSTEFHGQQSSWGSEWGTQKRGGSSKVPLCNHLSVVCLHLLGLGSGCTGSSLGLPCRLPQAFLSYSHLLTHNAQLSSAHGSKHHVPRWTIPSPPPDQRTAPHLLLLLLSYALAHPFHLSTPGSELSIQLLGSPGPWGTQLALPLVHTELLS